MRDDFIRLAKEYPANPPHRDPAFSGSPLVGLLRTTLPAAAIAAVPEIEGRYIVKGSAGDRGWTHTPWLAFLDPAVTQSIKEGFYVVYLMSLGGERLYLTLNQGCTRLKEGPGGLPGARAELKRRADAMRSRLAGRSGRLQPLVIDLNVSPSIWRGKLYELGSVLAVEYDTANLPTEAEMVADLREALELYRLLRRSGGWIADDEIEREAAEDGIHAPLTQAKRYHQHRSIERPSGHSAKVKRAQGTTCRGCDTKLSDVYGPLAEGLIDAHHLTPLSSLDDGSVVLSIRSRTSRCYAPTATA